MSADAARAEAHVAATIEHAVELDTQDLDADAKPRLLVETTAPDRTVAALRDILVEAGGLYDRGVPVRLAFDQTQKGTVAHLVTPDVLVLLAHRVCRPYALKPKQDGSVVEVDVRLSRTFAVMYLDWRGEWRLPGTERNCVGPAS